MVIIEQICIKSVIIIAYGESKDSVKAKFTAVFKSYALNSFGVFDTLYLVDRFLMNVLGACANFEINIMNFSKPYVSVEVNSVSISYQKRQTSAKNGKNEKTKKNTAEL